MAGGGGKGKGGQQSTSATQQVDPALRKEHVNMINAFKGLASQEKPIDQSVTIAGFTPGQEAAFSMGDSAASSFGFTPADRSSMPATETSALGIEGYAPGREAQASMDAVDPAYRAAMSDFYANIGEEVKDEKPKTSGGGGKK